MKAKLHYNNRHYANQTCHYSATISSSRDMQVHNEMKIKYNFEDWDGTKPFEHAHTLELSLRRSEAIELAMNILEHVNIPAEYVHDTHG